MDAKRLYAALQALTLVAGDEVSGVIQRLESHQNIDARDRTAIKALRQAVRLSESILSQEASGRPQESAPMSGRDILATASVRELRMYLDGIKEIIENVDQRAMATDGPVTPTLQEMTQAEMSEIYESAVNGSNRANELLRNLLRNP